MAAHGAEGGSVSEARNSGMEGSWKRERNGVDMEAHCANAREQQRNVRKWKIDRRLRRSYGGVGTRRDWAGWDSPGGVSITR